MHGRTIDIKRFAVHDGPGVRTTLFLKGCSLHCLWCHNPESISPAPELAIHYPKCVGCGDCAAVCPTHKIEGGKHLFERSQCTACGKCADACLYGALELFGKTISVERAAELLLEDKIFYTDGGGITVSGGEPLLQANFCAELFKRMKAEQIHCAVDTCGNVPWSAFEKVLPFADMFLYDFKCADSAKHKELTGCGNELIIKNLQCLSAANKPIEIRMIMVPEHNMSEADLTRAGEILSAIPNITAVRLLAYHSLARSKFAAVGRPDTMPDVHSPDAAELDKAGAILKRFSLHVINSLEK